MSTKISEYLFFFFFFFVCVFFFFSVGIPLLPPPPSPPNFFFLQIWILCQNSLTRGLKIRVVGCRVCTLKVIHIFCNVVCFTLCRWLLFCILPLLTVWHTVLVSMFPPPPPPPPPHPHPHPHFFLLLDMDSVSKFTY